MPCFDCLQCVCVCVCVCVCGRMHAKTHTLGVHRRPPIAPAGPPTWAAVISLNRFLGPVDGYVMLPRTKIYQSTKVPLAKLLAARASEPGKRSMRLRDRGQVLVTGISDRRLDHKLARRCPGSRGRSPPWRRRRHRSRSWRQEMVVVHIAPSLALRSQVET